MENRSFLVEAEFLRIILRFFSLLFIVIHIVFHIHIENYE